MDSKTTNSTGTQAPQQVQAGTAKLSLVLPGGKSREVQVPAGFFRDAAASLDLNDEGTCTVIDHTSKEQAARRIKMEEYKGHALQNVLLWCQAPGSSGKYAVVIACGGCKVPVRRYTSDLHQARHCLTCGIKAKRAKVAEKRAEKRAESRQAAE